MFAVLNDLWICLCFAGSYLLLSHSCTMNCFQYKLCQQSADVSWPLHQWIGRFATISIFPVFPGWRRPPTVAPKHSRAGEPRRCPPGREWCFFSCTWCDPTWRRRSPKEPLNVSPKPRCRLNLVKGDCCRNANTIYDFCSLWLCCWYVVESERWNVAAWDRYGHSMTVFRCCFGFWLQA